MLLPSTRVQGKLTIHPLQSLVFHTQSSHYDSINSKQANRGKNMAALIEEEGLNEDGLPEKRRSAHRQHKRKCKQVKKVVQGEDKDDDEDSEFLSSGSGDSDESGSESDSNGSDGMIPNDKVYSSLLLFIPCSPCFQIADMLPLKMAPSTKQTKSMLCSQQMNLASGFSTAKSTMHAKKKSCKTTVKEVEDEDSPQNISACNRAASPDPPAPTEMMSSNTEQKKKVCILMPCITVLTLYVFQKSGGVKRSNPIYLFYEVIHQNASGQPGDPGDKHYRCFHGNHKILTVTKLMKSNLNGSCAFFSIEMVLFTNVQLRVSIQKVFATQEANTVL
jgi:hypothetical protein